MIRTILFFAWFWFSLLLTMPICLVALIARLVGFKTGRRAALGFVVKVWAGSCLAVAGVKVRVAGLENIHGGQSSGDVNASGSGGVCFVGNHQGTFDILAVLACFPGTVGFITKREAIFVPLLNVWIIALGSVFIDRKSARTALASIAHGAEKIRRGASLVIFPEGTRSRGPDMGEFRPGALKLATMAGAPVVPFRINHSYAAWEEKKMIRPVTIDLAFLPAIATRGMDSGMKKALAERVRLAIEGAKII